MHSLDHILSYLIPLQKKIFSIVFPASPLQNAFYPSSALFIISLAPSHTMTLEIQWIVSLPGWPKAEIVIGYAGMVYQVLQAEANTSAKSTHHRYRFMSAPQLHRLSRVSENMLKWNIEEFLREQQQKIKTPSPDPPGPSLLLGWGHSWQGDPVRLKRVPILDSRAFHIWAPKRNMYIALGYFGHAQDI